MTERLRIADMRKRAEAYGFYIHKRFGGYFVLSYSQDNYAEHFFTGSLREISHFMQGLNHRPSNESRYANPLLTVAYSAVKYTADVADAIYYSIHGTLEAYQQKTAQSEMAWSSLYTTESKLRKLFTSYKQAPLPSAEMRASVLTEVTIVTQQAMEQVFELLNDALEGEK
jgi:hypothetical protein